MFLQSNSEMHGRGGFHKELSVCVVCIFLFGYFFIGWSQSPWITAVDRNFFYVFDKFTQKSWALDTLISEILVTDTVRIVPLLACIVWLLFSFQRQKQSVLFFAQTILGTLLAMILSRLMQNFSAFRPRPLHNPDLVYQLPYGIDTSVLEGWSSFPSDTTALAFAIAAGIFLASKRLGIAAFIWAVVIVAFPRSYAGLHYPSDLIGGALIGLFSTLGAATLIFRATQHRINVFTYDKWMPLIWALAFMYMYQIGTMFNDVRALGYFAKAILGL